MMNIPAILALLTVGAGVLSPSIAEARPLEGSDVVARAHQPGEVIVRFEGEAPSMARLNKEMKVDLQVRRTLSGGALLLSFDEGRGLNAERLVDRLAKRGDVVYAQPNWIVQAFATPNDELYADQWHYPQIRLPEAWDISTGSPNVVVAVLDSGSTDHPDLRDKWIQGHDFVSSRFIANDGNGRDDDPTDPGRFPIFHGTHVAGTVGAATDNDLGVAGVCWSCPVQPVRVLGSLTGSSADIIDAIRWAAGMSVPGAPDNENPADIINMSLGGDLGSGNTCAQDDPATQAAIDDARAAGVFVIAAAGNSDLDAGSFTPAGCDGVFTVAATDGSDGLAFYSNFGDVVELSAPGGGATDPVISTYDVDDYVGYQGTSQAAPHVAGVAGLLLSVSPGLSPDELERILIESAEPMNDRQCGGGCGAGRLDAAAALEAAERR